MRPPAIHQVYQICPDDVIVLVFGDGSIYEYSDFRTPVETVIAAFIHGRKFNAPGFRRPKYPRFTAPYERLEEVPGRRLLVYEEPPYRAIAELPTCSLLELLSYWTFEETSGTRADSHGNNDLTIKSSGCSSTTGIIGNGVLFDQGGGGHGLEKVPTTDPDLILDMERGITICGWTQQNAFSFGSSTQQFRLFGDNWLLEMRDPVGASAIQVSLFETAPSVVGDTLNVYTGPTNTWLFYRVWVDPNDALLRVKINEATLFTGTVPLTIVPEGDTSFQMFSTAATLFRNDEMGVWKGVISDADGEALFNSGAAETYPDVPGL